MTKTYGLESVPPPTCCTRYPPGCTVLECRLDGNQPVAHVVHIPSDSSPSPAMCLLVETRQSQNGPISRVAARPGKNVATTPQAQESYHLESRKGPKGAVAIAGRSPGYTDGSSVMSGPPLTLLETTKSEGPIARVLYHPNAETESCSQHPVSTHIECTTTPEGPFAKVTQSTQDKEAVNRHQESSTCFETFVTEDGSCPTATAIKGPLINCGPSAKSEILETKIVNGEVTAKGVVIPNGTALYLESRPSEEIPGARIDQLKGCKLDQFIDTLQRSNPQDLDLKTKLPCSPKIKEKIESSASKVCPSFAARPRSCILQESLAKGSPTQPAALSRRNGLDPTPSEILGKEGKWKYLKPIKKIQRPRVCSVRCEENGQFDAVPLTKSEVSDSKIKAPCKTEDVSKRGTHIQSESGSRSEASSKIVEVKRGKSLKSVRENDGSFQEVPLPSPDELIKDYREYLSDAQLRKYQYCSSRRNGLQDECYLSVPRAVVEIKKEEMRMKKKE